MATLDFFLSFSGVDRSTADLVHQVVTGAGFSCFYQHQDIAAGADFVHRMTSGLTEAATMLALFSDAYFQSKYAKAELHAAFADDPLNERRSILPLLIQPCAVPKPFNALAYVDCRSSGEAGIRRLLLAAIEPYRRQSTSPASRIPETNTAAAAQVLLDDLEIAYAIVTSQCEVRDALVEAMREREPSFERLEYEPFIGRYYSAMTPEERSLHSRLREHTETIEKLNRHALYCIEASKDFARRIPRMGELREHLEAWLDKYDRTFEADPSVGVVYVGVQERKPFPVGVEAGIRHYIAERTADTKR